MLGCLAYNFQLNNGRKIRYSPNISTTPLWQWGFRQCLPYNQTALRGKHCGHPIAVMGVVDTFRHKFGPTLQTHPCNENRVFTVQYFLKEKKKLFSSTGNPVMKTGFFLCGNTTQGKPCSGPVLALFRIAVYSSCCCFNKNHPY